MSKLRDVMSLDGVATKEYHPGSLVVLRSSGIEGEKTENEGTCWILYGEQLPRYFDFNTYIYSSF